MEFVPAWVYNHTNLIGLEKVHGEMALIMTLYSFKRVMNIFKFDEFLAKLKKWNLESGRIVWAFFQIDLILSKMTMPTNAVRTCALNY
jgi:hypothetical protein